LTIKGNLLFRIELFFTSLGSILVLILSLVVDVLLYLTNELVGPLGLREVVYGGGVDLTQVGSVVDELRASSECPVVD